MTDKSSYSILTDAVALILLHVTYGPRFSNLEIFKRAELLFTAEELSALDGDRGVTLPEAMERTQDIEITCNLAIDAIVLVGTS